MDHGDLDERFTGLRPVFVVPAQSAIAIEPRNRPFDHPTPRQQLPTFDQLVPLDDFQHPTTILPQPGDQLPRITSIGPDQSHTGAFGLRTCEYQLGPVTVLDVCRMDHDAQQQAHRIDQQMPFCALNLLACVITAEAAGATPFDRLAVDDGRSRFVLLALLPSHLLAQHIQDSFPNPGAAPGVEVVTDRAFRREVVRQGPPSTAVLVHIEDGIDDLAQVDSAVSPAAGCRGQQGSQQRPLGIGQVRRIRLPVGPGTHACSPGIKGHRSPPSFQDSPSRQQVVQAPYLFAPFLSKRAHNPLLKEAGLTKPTAAVPWLGGDWYIWHAPDGLRERAATGLGCMQAGAEKLGVIEARMSGQALTMRNVGTLLILLTQWIRDSALACASASDFSTTEFAAYRNIARDSQPMTSPSCSRLFWL